MEEYGVYLPRDKHDFKRTNQLYSLDPSILVSIIPSLVEWLQDMNWPISKEIANLLLEYPEDTIPYIKDVLNTNDDIWKEWCLRYFVMKLPSDLIKEFTPQLIRMATTPTEGELLEEVNETAQMILSKI